MRNFRSRVALCGWHLQKNLVCHLSKFKASNTDLYNKTISLPFVTAVDKFEKIVQDIRNDDNLSNKQKEYIELKLKTKNMWGKCFLKTSFIGGVSTTSRVEAIHAKNKIK